MKIKKLNWPEKAIFDELKKLRKKTWMWPWQSITPEIKREAELQKKIPCGKDIVEKINELIDAFNKKI